MTNQISTADVIDVLEEADEPVLGTKQIADELGFSRQHVGQYLTSVNNRRIAKTEVGGSAGWYLAKDPNPAATIERTISGMRLVGVSGLPCGDCNEVRNSGDRVITLFERSQFEWSVLNLLCEHHLESPLDAVDQLGMRGYIEDAFDSIEFALVSGKLTSGVDHGLNISDVDLLLYLPREGETTNGHKRPPEFDYTG